MPHNRVVISVAFSPDGKTAATAGADHVAWLWTVAPMLPDEPERVALRVAVQTGRYFDDQGFVRLLSVADWRARREQLAQFEGPPVP